MKIREYTENDLAAIETLHREGKHNFELPNPFGRNIVARKCFLSDGRIRIAGFGRLQLNAYLLLDRTWKEPADRLEAIEIFEAAMIEEGKMLGLDQVTAQVSPRFGRRLKVFGWEKSPGETWHKDF